MSKNYSNSHVPDSHIAPPELTIGNRIVWKSTREKGRGVYTVVDIQKGEIIEQSPVTIISKSETDLIDKNIGEKSSVIDNYLLRWRTEVEGQEYCLGHGYLMLYNHHPEPNGSLAYDFEHKTISMVALRDIDAGEEICFDYDCEIWFETQY